MRDTSSLSENRNIAGSTTPVSGHLHSTGRQLQARFSLHSGIGESKQDPVYLRSSVILHPIVLEGNGLDIERHSVDVIVEHRLSRLATAWKRSRRQSEST